MLKLVRMNQFLRPKFILLTLTVLLVSFGVGPKSLVDASPIDNTKIELPGSVEDAKNTATDFWQRFKNTFSFKEEDKNKPKLTVTEIVLLAVGAFVAFFILMCCIGYCLCECVKELVCCILCCKCFS